MACHLSYFCHIFPAMRTIASEQLLVMDHTGKVQLRMHSFFSSCKELTSQ